MTMTANQMDRRELLHRASLLLGGAITASAATGILAGCAATPWVDGPTPMGPTGSFLTPLEMATVTSMADQIIPKTETPGALDVGVPAFIDRMLAGYYQQRERDVMRAGLKLADNDARLLRGVSFAQLTGSEQVALMTRYDREQYDYTRANALKDPPPPPHAFRLLKELTILGFCTSEPGATKLMYYNQNPGPYRGDLPLSEVGKVSAL
jgi:gluconate 2-dehydrogenase gamma chain